MLGFLPRHSIIQHSLWCRNLYLLMKCLILWPDREELQMSMPMEFRKYFGVKVSIIIDCFEIFIDRPSNLLARAETWSNYKHHNTVKYLMSGHNIRHFMRTYMICIMSRNILDTQLGLTLNRYPKSWIPRLSRNFIKTRTSFWNFVKELLDAWVILGSR
jgi:hypothetical protein